MAYAPQLPAAYAPFVDAQQRPLLADSFVGLLDTLGTRNQTGARATEFLDVTHRALERARRDYETGDVPIVVRWFSDNAVRGIAHETGDWTPEFNKLSNAAAIIIVTASIQMHLSNMGLFHRGGLATGRFHAEPQFVFGEALVEAHELEEQTAVYPRAILSRDFARYARENIGPRPNFPWEIFGALLAVDHDGAVFVDYLTFTRDEQGDDFDACLENHLRHVQSHRDNAKSEKIRLKYGWLADYHDRFCRTELADHPRLERFLDDPNATTTLRRLA